MKYNVKIYAISGVCVGDYQDFKNMFLLTYFFPPTSVKGDKCKSPI